MKDNKTKKELIAQYKERQIVGGVYVIKNTLNNKILLGATTDLHSAINRFEFSQKTGSCVDMKLQGDWREFNGKQFVIEVLEELKKSETQMVEEYEADIDVLRQLWLDKLSGSEMY